MLWGCRDLGSQGPTSEDRCVLKVPFRVRASAVLASYSAFLGLPVYVCYQTSVCLSPANLSMAGRRAWKAEENGLLPDSLSGEAGELCWRVKGVKAARAAPRRAPCPSVPAPGTDVPLQRLWPLASQGLQPGWGAAAWSTQRPSWAGAGPGQPGVRAGSQPTRL